MVDCYVGEIRLFAGLRPPNGWALCNGQVLNMIEYGPLASLLQNLYGGNGQTTFALPDLRGYLVCGSGKTPELSSYALAQTFGLRVVILNPTNLPPHQHTMLASSAEATSSTPEGNVYAQCPSGYTTYVSSTSTNTTKAPSTAMLSYTGAYGPHDNHMPCLALNYIIALEGFYPAP
ncbi:MAG: tail fiber protein [Rhodospirillaceae bacterium]|nr:tail fiber protein [Rhodospirillaceae bacterium]